LKGGLNTYGYVDGNPLNDFDRFGLEAGAGTADIPWELPKWCTKIAGGIFGALAMLPGDTREEDCSGDGGGGGNDDRERHCKNSDGGDGTDDNCEALYQSILETCYGLKGRKRFKCFEAARISRDQCYQERKK